MTRITPSGGVLYVVATPIGNLGDITPRALEVLASVDLIAAEDTRHSGTLLRHFNITTPLLAYHEHNEREATHGLVTRLAAGARIAVISDAGTPLISDPGYPLVRAVLEQGNIAVIPIPGASALLAALSVAGLATDRFVFEGFLPPRSSARRERLAPLVQEIRTLVFYEAPHRLEECLADLASLFGGTRPAVLARELTKVYETLRRDTLDGLRQWVAKDPQQRRGECVLLVAGAPHTVDEREAEGQRVVKLLLEELPVKQAASLAARITGAGRNGLYRWALDNIVSPNREENHGPGPIT